MEKKKHIKNAHRKIDTYIIQEIQDKVRCRDWIRTIETEEWNVKAGNKMGH